MHKSRVILYTNYIYHFIIIIHPAYIWRHLLPVRITIRNWLFFFAKTHIKGEPIIHLAVIIMCDQEMPATGLLKLIYSPVIITITIKVPFGFIRRADRFLIVGFKDYFDKYLRKKFFLHITIFKIVDRKLYKNFCWI